MHHFRFERIVFAANLCIRLLFFAMFYRQNTCDDGSTSLARLISVYNSCSSVHIMLQWVIDYLAGLVYWHN